MENNSILLKSWSFPGPPTWVFLFLLLSVVFSFVLAQKKKKKKKSWSFHILKAKGLLEFAYSGRVVVMEYHDRMELQGFGDVFLNT